MSVFVFLLFLQKSIIVWTYHKDDLPLREILLLQPFKFKLSMKENGNDCKIVLDNLNKLDSEQVEAKQRAVRERFGSLKTQFEAKT